MISEAVNHFGKVDSLILNAGLSMWTRFDQITDISLFNKITEVNYQGSVNCVYSCLGELQKNRGHIISITTAQALIGFPNASAYAASKHALHGFLETLQLELGNKINISNVYLGWIKGTNLRANALGSDGVKIGSKHHKHSSRAIELEDCTSKIIQGIERNKKTIFIPYFLKFIPWARVFFKNWLFNKIVSVTNQEER
tara:strand:- start:1221 stop:1814 length:594 start_codon:yes stop_codon:yes gene_type:complete